MISIVIPSYNRAYIIGRALDSISKQTYTDWECLIADDYSTDNTESVVNSYTEKDSRFRFLKHNRSKGAQGARNTGILAAKGEWVVLFDSDNIMHPDFLEKCSKRQLDTNCDVVNTWSRVIDTTSMQQVRSFSWVNNGMIHKSLLTGKCYVDNSSTMIRKSFLTDIGLLAEDCPAFQEWDTHIRLSNIAVYQTIEEYLIDYFVGAADAISSSKRKDVKGYLFILTKFKKEWIRRCPLHFCKYAAILKTCIDTLDANERAAYEKEFSKLTGILKPVVLILANIITKRHGKE